MPIHGRAIVSAACPCANYCASLVSANRRIHSWHCERRIRGGSARRRRNRYRDGHRCNHKGADGHLRPASVHSNNPGDPSVSLSSLGFVTGANTLGTVNSGNGEEAVPRISLQNFSFGRVNPTLVQPNNTWTITEGYSRIHGTHTLKFGAEGRYLQINGRNFYGPNGLFSFDGSETGSDCADYFLGPPSSFIQSSLQVIDSRTKYFGVYGQDSWRVRPNLTLNYGLRWEFSMPWYDIYDRLNAIIPGVQSTLFPTAPKGWLVPGDPNGRGGTLTRTIKPTDYNNFAPRVGLAWAPQTRAGLTFALRSIAPNRRRCRGYRRTETRERLSKGAPPSTRALQ